MYFRASLKFILSEFAAYSMRIFLPNTDEFPLLTTTQRFPAPVPLLASAHAASPAVHLFPANGFPPATYLPLLTPLGQTRRIFSLPARPLWQPAPDPSGLHSWEQLGDDLIAGIREHGLRDVIAIGHSFGGVASMVAAVRAPEHFRALILLDPTIFPEIAYPAIRIARAFGQEVRLPLVQQALRRRAQFASLDAAFTYWRGKRLFHDWSDEALWAYVRAALVPDAPHEPAGSEMGLHLRWSAAWEARIYETVYAGVWRTVRALRGLSLPMLFIRGETTEVFAARTAQRIRRLVPQADHAEIAGRGHLFPMSDPAATSAVIAGWLEQRGL